MSKNHSVCDDEECDKGALQLISPPLQFWILFPGPSIIEIRCEFAATICLYFLKKQEIMERTDERFDPMFDHDNPRFPEVEPVLPPEPQPQDTQQYAGVEYQRTLSGEDQERKMEEEKEFLDLKNALMNYDFKKSPRIQKEIYGNLDGSDIDVVRIALFGPTGSGKTTLIGKNNWLT